MNTAGTRARWIGLAALGVVFVGGGYWLLTRSEDSSIQGVRPDVARLPETCTWTTGSQMSWDGQLATAVAINFAGVARTLGAGEAKNTQTGQVAKSEVMQANKLGIDFRLDATVLEVRPDHSALLGARFRTMDLEGVTLDPGPASKSPFLLEMRENCSIAGYAYRGEADMETIARQHSVLGRMNWALPKKPGTRRYIASHPTEYGSASYRYAVTDLAGLALLGRQHLRADEVRQDFLTSGEILVEGVGDRILPNAQLWVDSIISETKTVVYEKGIPLTQTIAKFHVERKTDPLPVDLVYPDAGWHWLALHDAAIYREARRIDKERTDAAEWPEWEDKARMLSREDIRTQALALIASDQRASLSKAMRLMAAWLRTHPEEIPAFIDDVKAGVYNERYARSLVFLALGKADTIESRDALFGFWQDPGASGSHRSQAALALAGASKMPIGFVDSLVEASQSGAPRSEIDGAVASHATAVLGEVIARHANDDPESVEKARQVFREGMQNRNPDRLLEVLNGIGNSGDASLLPELTENLGANASEQRAATHQATRNMPPEAYAPVFVGHIDTEPDPQVRTTMVLSAYSQAHQADRLPPPAVLDVAVRNVVTETDKRTTQAYLKLLDHAGRFGSTDAKAAMAERFKREMNRPDRDQDLIQTLGAFIDEVPDLSK